MTIAWFDAERFGTGSSPYSTYFDKMCDEIVRYAASNGKVVYSGRFCCEFITIDKKVIFESLRSLFGFSVFHEYTGRCESGKTLPANVFCLVSDIGVIELNLQPNSYNPSIMVMDEKLYDNLVSKFAEWICPSNDDGIVYGLESDNNLEFKKLGACGSSLLRGNYTSSVLNAVDHIVEDLKSKDPCGRIGLLTGPPGTGKTHLIRSIFSSVPEARFIVLPPNFVGALLEPGAGAALRKFASNEAKERNIVLVIEDAEECLLPRGTDNMSQISALLNISDGIVGSIFSIRVLATTNAKRIEIDSAVKRSMRMCKASVTNVDILEHAHARSVLERLVTERSKVKAVREKCDVEEIIRTAGPISITRSMSLADVYAEAHAMVPNG